MLFTETPHDLLLRYADRSSPNHNCLYVAYVVEVEVTPSEIVEAYEALRKRAIEMASVEAYVEDDAWLKVEGDEAVLEWPECKPDYYGGGILEYETQSIPLDWLSRSDEWLNEYRQRIAKQRNENNAMRQAESERLQEIAERAMLAELLKKYPQETE